MEPWTPGVSNSFCKLQLTCFDEMKQLFVACLICTIWIDTNFRLQNNAQDMQLKWLFMWRGHDLKLVRPQIAKMLATARKLRPTFQRGLETPAETNHAHQSDRGSHQPICHCAEQHQANEASSPRQWPQLASYKRLVRRRSGQKSNSTRQTDR